MLKLEGALRDIQDATASLDEMTAARDADVYRRAFGQCLSHLRSAQWKIHKSVQTAARQEPGRPRVEAATAWWAAQARTIDNDPLLTWARDAGDDAIHDVSMSGVGSGSPAGGVVELKIAVLRAPSTHLGNTIPADQQTPTGLLSMCIAHCGDVYDRAMRAWS